MWGINQWSIQKPLVFHVTHPMHCLLFNLILVNCEEKAVWISKNACQENKECCPCKTSLRLLWENYYFLFISFPFSFINLLRSKQNPNIFSSFHPIPIALRKRKSTKHWSITQGNIRQEIIEIPFLLFLNIFPSKQTDANVNEKEKERKKVDKPGSQSKFVN